MSDEKREALPEQLSAAPQQTEGQSELSEPDDGTPLKEERDAPKDANKAIKSYALEFLIRAGVTVLAVWLVLTFAAGVYVCHTNAASPRVQDGDLCVTLRLSQPAPGDMAVFRHEGQTHFWRVAAQAGDRVEIGEGYVRVNGDVFSDDLPALPDGTGGISYPYTVPEGCVFVLCDNRSRLSDSRTFGAVPCGECQGKIVFLMRRRGF